ncbi:MAG: hypothetical protein M1290_00670 [Candidatus Thermoplasmatota archaeon]|nr:hypothetical protein [Candidatus Thermoplasmatota archaeon]
MNGDNPVGNGVRVIMLRENRWGDLDTWLPEGYREFRLFPTSSRRPNGRFNDEKIVWSGGEISEGSDHYRYDPRDPTQFVTEIYRPK